jgi:hypothetical protein
MSQQKLRINHTRGETVATACTKAPNRRRQAETRTPFSREVTQGIIFLEPDLFHPDREA